MLPKNKFDIVSAHQLSKYSFDEIKPHILVLLEWIQDSHWEVAHIIGPLLSKYSNLITEEILEILNGNDEQWKFNCIRFLLLNNSNPIDNRIIDRLKKFQTSPTVVEIEEELPKISTETLENRV